jgi:hypothetical protein
MTPSTNRRHLLKLATAAASTLWLPRSAWSQARFSGNPFALGVASGSPTHDSLVLWTRLVQTGLFGSSTLGTAPVTVRWEIADDEGFTRIVQSGQAQALAELAHSVHVEVAGLASDRWYFYRFMAGDAVSPVGRTRTFPAPDAPAARLRVAYASCQRWEHGYFSAWRHLRDDQPDVVLFLGDYIYEYASAPNAVRQPTGGWVLTLDDYRARYALHRSEHELQAMHAACPWLVTWDDHEVQNDYAGLTPGNSGPPVADFAARRAAAYQAFYEHMPLRASVLTQALAGLASGAEMRIYGQVAFGRLATLFLLDDRQYRDPQVCNRDGRLGSSLVNPERCASWTTRSARCWARRRSNGWTAVDHGRNMLLAWGPFLFVVAQVPPQRLMALAVPLYVLGVALLVAVALFGITKKGATRWLNVGVVIQPSEILKIAMPLMLAWWFQKREGPVAPARLCRRPALLLLVPAALIMKQPDLGTALLVLAAGLYVIFFAGLSWKLIVPPVLVGCGHRAAGVFRRRPLPPGVRWPVLHDYQQQRVCTLLDPTRTRWARASTSSRA